MQSELNNSSVSRQRVTAAASSSTTARQQQQPDTSFVSLDELKELCSKSLSTIGYTNSEIAVLLEVRTSCMGNSAQLPACREMMSLREMMCRTEGANSQGLCIHRNTHKQSRQNAPGVSTALQLLSV